MIIEPAREPSCGPRAPLGSLRRGHPPWSSGTKDHLKHSGFPEMIISGHSHGVPWTCSLLDILQLSLSVVKSFLYNGDHSCLQNASPTPVYRRT